MQPDARSYQLTSSSASLHFAFLPYQPASSQVNSLRYINARHRKDTTPSSEATWDLSDANTLKRFQGLGLARSASWSPELLEINGRENRRAMVIFSNDRIHFRVFGLDAQPRSKTSSKSDTLGRADRTEDTDGADETEMP